MCRPRRDRTDGAGTNDNDESLPILVRHAGLRENVRIAPRPHRWARTDDDDIRLAPYLGHA